VWGEKDLMVLYDKACRRGSAVPLSHELSKIKAEHMDHAFALTVHKSQGSEFPVVVICLAPDHYTMQRR
jgi:ATP-dependent exoDNAse (exonuclease V) alpha subunit